IYSVTGSAWNSSFVTIHISIFCWRIIGSSIVSRRFFSHDSRTACCSRTDRSFGSGSIRFCAQIAAGNNSSERTSAVNVFIRLLDSRVLKKFSHAKAQRRKGEFDPPLRPLRLCVRSTVGAAEAALVCKDHCLRARPDAELVEDVRYVIAHGLFAD